MGSFWRLYAKNKLAVVGLLIVIFFLVLGAFAQYIAPYDPRSMNGVLFGPPNLQHLMGTDQLGRDILSGVIFGARPSMTIGFLAAITATFVGVLVGSFAGYYGGWVDDTLMKFTEVFLVIPIFVIALVAVSVFGPTIWNIVVVIGVLSWPTIARLVRADFLSLKKRTYTDAARVAGATDLYIMFRELLPNALPTVVVATCLQVATTILLEAGLAFLGLSDPNWISWGFMLNQSSLFFLRAWWLSAFPGLAIFAAVLGVNLVGDGLNDVLNPRLTAKSE